METNELLKLHRMEVLKSDIPFLDYDFTYECSSRYKWSPHPLGIQFTHKLSPVSIIAGVFKSPNKSNGQQWNGFINKYHCETKMVGRWFSQKSIEQLKYLVDNYIKRWI